MNKMEKKKRKQKHNYRNQIGSQADVGECFSHDNLTQSINQASLRNEDSNGLTK